MGRQTPGTLVRDLRKRKGLSQRQLALRAGTSQSAIDRIERGKQDVTWGRLRTLLLAMGEEPILASERLEHDADPADLLRARRRDPAERVEAAADWNSFASEVATAGKRARKRG